MESYFLQNYPLFIKTIPTDNELKFYYTVHTSLDVVEEKISSVGKNTNELRELYLGLLYPTEDYKVYPFIHMIFWDLISYDKSSLCLMVLTYAMVIRYYCSFQFCFQI